jgi:hypothetical protein
VVTNTGDVELTNVTVTDDIIGGITCPATTLAANGGTMTCTANGTATIGQYANNSDVVGTPPAGPNVTDEDPSHYFGTDPSIDIEKSTNGEDADNPTGPLILVGNPVLWEYFVTNTGNVELTNVTVTDNQGVVVNCPSTTLAANGGSMTCTGNGTAAAGQYANIGDVVGTPPVGANVTDMDPSHYFGVDPNIDIEKATNGVDADDPNAGDAPQINPGDLVSWTYVVTNTGNYALINISVVDDQGVPVSCPSDTLDVGESMICTASGLADDLMNTGFTTVPGLCGSVPNWPLYENMGTASGTTVAGGFVQDVDPSHYCNPPNPNIEIEKATNGVVLR